MESSGSCNTVSCLGFTIVVALHRSCATSVAVSEPAVGQCDHLSSTSLSQGAVQNWPESTPLLEWVVSFRRVHIQSCDNYDW